MLEYNTDAALFWVATRKHEKAKRLAQGQLPDGAPKFRLAEPRKLEAPQVFQVGTETLAYEEPKWTTYEERETDMNDIFSRCKDAVLESGGLVVGPPGSGKSTMLSLLADEAARLGLKVANIAPTFGGINLEDIKEFIG